MNRRNFLRMSGAAGLTLGSGAGSGNFNLLAGEGEPGHGGNFPIGKADHCIYIWLGGGAAQIDTWDPKKMGDAKKKVSGSYYKSIDTNVSGVKVCEHLKQCAGMMDKITAVRTVHHPVIDEHAAAVNRMHTGRPVSGTIQYPSLGSIVYHERGGAAEGVPGYVVIGYPNLTREPGFLGAKYGYLYLLDTAAGPAGLKRPSHITPDRQSRREQLLSAMRETATDVRGGSKALVEYDAALEESLRLAGPEFMSVFNLTEEKPGLRQQYGGEFGQRLLLSRRLLQSGVRFIEVSHNLNFVNGTGWDTHNAGQLNQHILIQELDQALSTLITDLEEHEMLDRTLIVIGTEFGRPAAFDSGGGRGHQSTAFTMVLAGGGLKHQGAYGVTDELSKEPVENPVSVPDFFSTIHCALGINPAKELFDGDRPVPITDRGQPLRALFA